MLELEQAKAQVNLFSPAVVETLVAATKSVDEEMTNNMALRYGCTVTVQGFVEAIRETLDTVALMETIKQAAFKSRDLMLSHVSQLPLPIAEAWNVVERDKRDAAVAEEQSG